MRTKAFGILLLVFLNAELTRAGEPISMMFDLGDTGKTITNKFGDINMFSVSSMWTEAAAKEPNDYFRCSFPFVQRVQLMGATGGEGRRDLFKDPNDRTTLTDYDFSRLATACQNIVALGLKPMIKTGWVPPKFSANPKMSRAFHTNVRPPSDYDAYYAYIKAIAEALKNQFGLTEVKTWAWGVGVEYDNRGWFEADDGNAQTTKRAYFRLYDTTVAALEDALGAKNVTVGAHSMSAPGGRAFWDSGDFIEHCARGENLKRGGTGTRLSYLALSYYTRVPGFDGNRFVASFDSLRSKAEQLGLKSLKYGVDEGRVLNGWDNRVLYPREVEHPMQAAGDAKLFHLMVDHDVDYFSCWSWTTEDMGFGGLPVASAHLRNMAYRMCGSALVEAGRSGRPADVNDDVGSLGGYDAPSKTFRMLLYNFSHSRDANTNEEINISIRNVRPSAAVRLTRRTWLLDEDHGNWWKAWQADMAARKMGPQSFKLSSSTYFLPGELIDPADVEFWKSREAEYGKLGQLKSADEEITPGADGAIAWQVNLKPNAVVLYEVFPVELARPPKASP